MKIEIHLLQNVAPSCLNRDDTNTPKSCEFGGANRARVSSQSWKRAVREFFREENSVPVGSRTKRLIAKLKEPQRLGENLDVAAATKFLTEAYSKMDSKRTTETAVLVFVSDAEVDIIAACLREGVSGKDAAPRLKAVKQSADIALFGRMLAENPLTNVDAACQVAHALSTHAVNLETDFYTAVDDLTQERDEIGAGMLGTQGFNSACFYRYALIDSEQLIKNLGGDGEKEMAYKTIEAFLRAFTLAIPSAKQNSHAAQNPPSFGLFVARETGVPVSLANAFANPIYASKDKPDIIDSSITALLRYQSGMNRIYGLYKDATQATFSERSGEAEEVAASDESELDKAIATIMKRVRGAAA